MIIYAVYQVSWNGGKLSDFDLPKLFGYFLKHESAQKKLDSLVTKMNQHEKNVDSDCFVEPYDFRITTVAVEVN